MLSFYQIALKTLEPEPYCSIIDLCITIMYYVIMHYVSLFYHVILLFCHAVLICVTEFAHVAEYCIYNNLAASYLSQHIPRLYAFFFASHYRLAVYGTFKDVHCDSLIRSFGTIPTTSASITFR